MIESKIYIIEKFDKDVGWVNPKNAHEEFLIIRENETIVLSESEVKQLIDIYRKKWKLG